MKKFLIFLVFILFVYGVYYVRLNYFGEEEAGFYFRDSFDELDRNTWFVGEMNTYFPAYEKAELKEGVLSLIVRETDRGPFLLSKPFEVPEGAIITIRKKMKVHYANENFTGATILYETSENTIRPSFSGDQQGPNGLGYGIVAIEYVHNFDEDSIRPGRDIFRVLPPTWQTNENYALVDPVFDEWFIEEIVYDTRNGRITYRLNEHEDIVKGMLMDLDHIRIMMHSYGYYTGHRMEIDWIEITMD